MLRSGGCPILWGDSEVSFFSAAFGLGQSLHISVIHHCKETDLAQSSPSAAEPPLGFREVTAGAKVGCSEKMP